MASVIANGPGTPMVPRGRAVNLGTLPINASTTAVQFTVSQLVGNPNGFDDLLIFTVGGTVGTPVLEGSVDGGVTWFGITASGASSSATQVSTTVFGGDTAVTSANTYIIAGLQGLTLFRWGAAVTIGSTAVWVACA